MRLSLSSTHRIIRIVFISIIYGGANVFKDNKMKLAFLLKSEGHAAGSLGLGYEFSNNWRIEGDLAQLWTDNGAISQLPNTAAKLQTKSAFINAIYDFSDFGRWEPYVGAGVGIVRSSATLAAHDFPSAALNSPGVVSVNSPACRGGVACSIKDSDNGFGWQLLAGLGYAISDNLTWDTQYRYLDAGNAQFEGSKAPALGSIVGANATLQDVGAHSLMTGFRYKFGKKATKMVAVPLPVAKGSYNCWDGSCALSAAECPPQPAPEPAPEPVRMVQCWDGTTVSDASQCPAQPQTYTCWDGSLVYDLNQCPVQQQTVVATQYNICGTSPVSIFNVDASATPKNIRRLGTMPQFGDSHGLTSDQFFEKLQARYAAGGADRAYLNYLFKSMGYTNGFRDAQAYMFSEETLPIGTTGILGLGEQHHYAYSVLNTSDRDREAFRIQSANGSVVHFMKTCGNYMYACQ